MSPASGGRLHSLGDLRDLLWFETFNPFVKGRLAERASVEKHLPLEKPFRISESQNMVLVSKIELHHFLKKELYPPSLCFALYLYMI